jgi:dipeptidase E
MVLLSNGYRPGGGRYLEHTLGALDDALCGVRRIAFVPYALRDWDGHTAVVARALAPLGVELIGVHRSASPRAALNSAEAVFVGGGNAFRLLAAMYRLDALESIITSVGSGVPYIGTSAGANLACPTIRTTNDMPIVEPPSLAALGLVPFQVNPHYPVRDVGDGHLGETRDRRLAEFLEDNDAPVLALYEGTWLDVEGSAARLGGERGAVLFSRRHGRTELGPGADVSRLLATTGRFDNPVV